MALVDRAGERYSTACTKLPSGAVALTLIETVGNLLDFTALQTAKCGIHDELILPTLFARHRKLTLALKRISK